MSLAFTVLTALSLLVGRGTAQPSGPMENSARQTIASFQREINSNRHLQNLAQDFIESAHNIDELLRAGDNDCIVRNPAMLSHHTDLFNNLTNGAVEIRAAAMRRAQGILPPQAFGS